MRGQPSIYVSSTPAKQAATRNAKAWWNPCGVTFDVFADSFRATSQETRKFFDAD